jgi:prepilin-type N-terminal cleavage/methylation domain-containing protein/prepilin-type processing-associated H-X9-DG protein
MKRRNGFTLVELLVVIGIISVLISMLLPALNKVRQSAWRISCQSQMKQVAYAMLMYANENHQTLPLIYGRATDPTANAYAVKDSWIWLIAPYVSNNYGTQDDAGDGLVRLFTCPAYHSTVGNGPDGTDVHVQRTYDLSYSSDTYFSGSGARPFPFGGISGTKLGQIKHPTEKAMVLEVWYTGPGNLYLYSNDTNNWGVEYDHLAPLPKPDLASSPYAAYNKAPHSGGSSYGANVAYCDGHVEWTRYDSNGYLSLNIWDPILDYNF